MNTETTETTRGGGGKYVLPKHPPTDLAKVASMVAGMQDGWPASMPAVLAIGDEAITGSHRLAAARLAEVEPRIIDLLEEGVDIEALGWTLEELLTTAEDDDIARLLRDAGRPDLAHLACGETS